MSTFSRLLLSIVDRCRIFHGTSTVSLKLAVITEGKVAPVHAMKACRWRWGTAPLVLNVCTRYRWVVNFTLWPLYPRRKGPRYHLTRNRSGPLLPRTVIILATLYYCTLLFGLRSTCSIYCLALSSPRTNHWIAHCAVSPYKVRDN
jgi:hypothetical protein